MAIDLSSYVEELAQRVEDPALARVGAEAMAETMRRALARHLGGDLGFSGFPQAGRAEPRPKGSSGLAECDLVGPAFALADGGRRQSRAARARKGSALATPWGPRESARGSRWRGWDLMGRAGAEALRDGIDAMSDALPRMLR